MKSRARRFTLVMLSATALFVGGPALMNYAVDPYDRFGNNRLGIYISAEREMKSTEVRRYPHTALFVGNSRMAAIPASRLNGLRWFNGAFSAANAEDIYWFLHHSAERQEIVVLGIDLGAKDPTILNGDIFRRGNWSADAEHLVNLQTVEYSFKTLSSHLAGKLSHYSADGSLTELDFGNPAKPQDAATAKAHLATFNNYMADVVLKPPRSLSYYRKIAETLRARKIPCVVVMPPMHEEVVRQIETLHLEKETKAWLDEVSAIFPNVVNLTSSRYSAAENFYAWDPVHYKSETGVRFMNEEVLPVVMKVLHGVGK
jgi:hypothetical protein